jgi:hypothetical protein
LKEARLVFDSFLAGCGVVAEAVLVMLLWRIRAFRSFPSFSVYICWSLVSDAFFFSIRFLYPNAPYALYEAQMVVDSAMIFAVLVELAWSVLRPIRTSLPPKSWIGIAILIALAGLLLWPVAGLTLPLSLTTSQARNYFRLQQTFAILRVVVFLSMAGFSQFLAIGWRNRELQIATGLGFYSIVSLATTIVHTHQAVGVQYHWLDEIGAASYLSALCYWVLAFATKEAERQNFSPQMQSFLLLVGSTARLSRGALTEMVVTKSRRKDHR